MEIRAHQNRGHRLCGQPDLDLNIGRQPAKEGLAMTGAVGKVMRRVLSKGEVPHICVVGAGFAGLRCADVLSQKGFKVTILEGRNRIGGRVSSSEMDCLRLNKSRCTK